MQRVTLDSVIESFGDVMLEVGRWAFNPTHNSEEKRNIEMRLLMYQGLTRSFPEEAIVLNTRLYHIIAAYDDLQDINTIKNPSAGSEEVPEPDFIDYFAMIIKYIGASRYLSPTEAGEAIIEFLDMYKQDRAKPTKGEEHFKETKRFDSYIMGKVIATPQLKEYVEPVRRRL